MRLRGIAAVLMCVGVVGGCTPLSAKAPTEKLSVPGTPRHLAVDFSHLYVASFRGPGAAITRFDKEEWQPTPVATTPGRIRQLALHNDSVYWLLDHEPKGSPRVALQRTSKQPGGPVTAVLSAAQPVTSFAFDATHLYWTQAGDQNDPDEAQSPGVLRVMDPSTTPTNVVTRQLGRPTGLALAGRYAYWINVGPDGTAVIMSWPKVGGPPAELLVLHPTQTEGSVPSLAAADDGVYVLAPRELLLLAGDGSSVKRIAKGLYAPKPSIVFDFQHLYFCTRDGVMRSKPEGKELVPFWAHGGSALVADDEALYWITANDVLYRPK